MGELDGPPWLLIYMVMADIMEFYSWTVIKMAGNSGTMVNLRLEIC